MRQRELGELLSEHKGEPARRDMQRLRALGLRLADSSLQIFGRLYLNLEEFKAQRLGSRRHHLVTNRRARL